MKSLFRGRVYLKLSSAAKLGRFLLLSLALVGCSEATLTASECPDGCDAGLWCSDGQCVQICSTSADCPAGNICEGELCIEGEEPVGETVGTDDSTDGTDTTDPDDTTDTTDPDDTTDTTDPDDTTDTTDPDDTTDTTDPDDTTDTTDPDDTTDTTDPDDTTDTTEPDDEGCEDGTSEVLAYEDSDGDGLGSGEAVSYCAEAIPAGWVTNADDPEPDCPTNDTDSCGVCAGGDADDLGCGCFVTGPQDFYIDADGDGLGAGDPIPYCIEGVPQGWVTNNDDLEPECPTNDTDDCGVCAGGNAGDLGCGCGELAPITYWPDDDSDGLGSGSSGDYCPEDIPSGWVTNNSDLEPNCPTNDTDSCGVCGGGNADDLGCGCFVDGPAMYYPDTDSDGLGAGDGASHCAGAEPAGWTTNQSDSEPDCSTNNTDSCGICNGGNALDLGCGCFNDAPTGCDALTAAEAGMKIKAHYDFVGEWAGSYTIAELYSVQILSGGSDSEHTVHAHYGYADAATPWTVAGQDSRSFSLSLQGGSWVVTAMGNYLSGQAPLTCANAVLDGDETTTDCGGSCGPCASLNVASAALSAKQWYDVSGEWAGSYVLASVESVDIVWEHDGQASAHVLYGYANAASPTTVQGYDSRIFSFTNAGGVWSTDGMGAYLSGIRPVSCTNGVQDDDEVAVDCGGSCGDACAGAGDNVCAALRPYQVGPLAQYHYDAIGEWAGTYAMAMVRDVDLTDLGNGTQQADVLYGYATVDAPTTVLGYDSRSFVLEQVTGQWAVASMGAYDSGSIPLTCTNGSLDEGETTIDCGGVCGSCKALPAEQAASMAKSFYDHNGEWAGQYVVAEVERVRVDSLTDPRTRAVHLLYGYASITDPTTTTGWDSRVFTLSQAGGPWVVTAMGEYLGADFPLTCSNDGLDEDEWTIDCGGACRDW